MSYYFEKKRRRKAELCHNCDTVLDIDDNFCRKCGQENHDKKVPVPHLLNEFAGDMFQFDNKVFTTLKSLFTKPGQITKDFLDGKRSRFVPPLRLYFIISAVYFFLYSCSEMKKVQQHQDPMWINNRVKQLTFDNLLYRFEVKRNDSLYLVLESKSLAEKKRLIVSLYQATLADTIHTFTKKMWTVERKYMKQLLAEFNLKLADTLYLRGIILNEKVKVKIDTAHDYWVTGAGVTKKIAEKTISYTDTQLDSLWQTIRNKKIKWYEKSMFKITRQTDYLKFLAQKKDEHYELILYPKTVNYTLFLLMPLVGFLLWLFFSKSRPFYYEHLICSINLHSFAFLIILIVTIFFLIWGVQLEEVLHGYYFIIVIIGCYLLLSLKYIYQQSWLKTITKTVALGILYALLYSICYIPIDFWVLSQFVKN